MIILSILTVKTSLDQIVNFNGSSTWNLSSISIMLVEAAAENHRDGKTLFVWKTKEKHSFSLYFAGFFVSLQRII